MTSYGPAMDKLLRCLVRGSMALLGVLVLGCSDVDTARWTEDVKSWDGRIFQLEGYAERGKSGWPLEHRGGIRFIEYYHPESGAYWKQQFGYQPVVFDFATNSVVVLLTANSDGKCHDYNFPPLGLIGFRWTNDGWESIAVETLPLDKMTFNLLREMFDREDASKDAQGFVSLPEKWRRSPPISVSKWIEESGRRCASLKESKQKFDVPPPPTLTGSHGQPTRFTKKGIN